MSKRIRPLLRDIIATLAYSFLFAFLIILYVLLPDITIALTHTGNLTALLYLPWIRIAAFLMGINICLAIIYDDLKRRGVATILFNKRKDISEKYSEI